MSRVAQLDDPQAEAAIGWMVEMTSGAMSEEQYQIFEAWLQADPRNEIAWVRLQEALMPCGVAARQGLDRGVLTNRLVKRQHNRRTFLAGLIGTVGVGGLATAVADRFLPLSHLLADRFTLTAQHERVMLADGSELTLAPQTALDLEYKEGLRGVRLLSGEVLVRVVSRAAPFQLSVDGIVLQTLSGTFMVETRTGTQNVSAIEGKGRVDRGLDMAYDIARGDQLVFSSGQVRRLAADLETTTAWIEGLLVAKNRTVGSIVEGLRPYFPGVIRLDPRVTDMRATGVFSLKNPNDALDALSDALNLSVSRIARYWVMIGLRDG